MGNNDGLVLVIGMIISLWWIMLFLFTGLKAVVDTNLKSAVVCSLIIGALFPLFLACSVLFTLGLSG